VDAAENPGVKENFPVFDGQVSTFAANAACLPSNFVAKVVDVKVPFDYKLKNSLI